MCITLIGAGGTGAELLPQAIAALTEAELVIGAPRLLESLPQNGARRVAETNTEAILNEIRSSGCRRCAVVFSGDTGFYSGAGILAARLRKEGLIPEIIPGISSFQLLAARLGRPWQDWQLVSAHGAKIDLPYYLKEGRPVAMLTGSGRDVCDFCRRLTDMGLGSCHVTVGERLSYPDEKILEGTADDFYTGRFADLNIMLIEPGPELIPLRRTPGIPDDEFIRGTVPMTKQPVRAMILACLGVMPEDVCWDIGAGTGSVSVELAMAARQVWAVEQGEQGLALIRENRTKFRTWNLNPVSAKAPEGLDKLPVPNAVFIGGSGGQLKDILEACVQANPDVRICVSAITLETLHRAVDWMEEKGLAPEVIQLSASRTRAIGKARMLLPDNPVFLICGRRICEGS